MFFDEKGQFISGAYVTALLADILLTKYGSNNRIIFDPRVIWPTLEVCKQKGATAIIAKGGHAFMKDRMRREDALFAGEMSAHYYFRENFYCDNGIIPFLLVLEHLSTQGKPFSEIMAPYIAGHYMSGELNYRVKDIKAVISKVQERYRSEGTGRFYGRLLPRDSRMALQHSRIKHRTAFATEHRGTQTGISGADKKEIEEIIEQ